MLPEKPYALSCDRNSEPILEVLKQQLQGRERLLEIGSGTGQHAIFMAPSFPRMTWTLTDIVDNHPGIIQWIKDFPRQNLRGPIEYDITKDELPSGDFDVVFTSNTIHIFSWELTLKLFDQWSQHLKAGCKVLIYGAFNYNGQFTSESNERFEQWLKDRDPQSGIRDFEKVKEELERRGFQFVEDIEMPANNRMLVFNKNEPVSN